MTRARLAIVVVATSLMIGLGSPAWAQGEPSLTIEPGTVEASGEQSLVVSGEGWTSSVVYILPCDVPGPGAQVDSGTCDTGAATPVSPTDGSFTFTKTFDVLAEGLALGAGDRAQTEFAAFVVTVAPSEEAEGTHELAATGTEPALGVIIGLALLAVGTMLISHRQRRAQPRPKSPVQGHLEP